MNKERHAEVNKLKVMFENFDSVSILVLDKHYRYTLVNDKYKMIIKKLIGLDIQVGMSVLDTIDKLEKNHIKKFFISRIKEKLLIAFKGMKVSTNEEVLIKKDQIEYYKIEMVPIKNKNGCVTEVGICILNITDRITVMKHSLKKKLDNSLEYEEKCNFLRNVSHEIRTPINGIIGLIDILLKDELTFKQREYMMAVKDSANSLLDNMNNILENCKTESNKLEIYHKKINDTFENNIDISIPFTIYDERKNNIKFEENVHKVEKEFKKSSKKREVKILVAEDNLVNQMVISQLIKILGWKSEVVNNGKEVMKELERDSYDLILMDISMPEMNGIEAMKAIREIRKFEKIPIIALTAYALAEDKERFIKLGMDDYLSKPIDKEKLYSMINKHLNLDEEECNKNELDLNDECFDGLNRLGKVLDGNTELIFELGNKMIKLFSKEQMDEIIYCIEKGKTTKLSEIIHKLKGAISNFGLTEINILLNDIKEKAVLGEIDSVYKLINEIDGNIKEFEEKLIKYCNKSKFYI
ncbi:response regulator [uncultured Clostridium sp.]|uniref:response regulator n=1 Tax=uncultured Clostridium sp. TaxID=59620 RepID=UPI0028E7FA64|nr:response regulator [uncultured Clostridium sp.]